MGQAFGKRTIRVADFIHFDTGTSPLLKRMEGGVLGANTVIDTISAPPGSDTSLLCGPGKTPNYSWPDRGGVNDTGQLIVGAYFRFSGGNWPTIALPMTILRATDAGSGICWKLTLAAGADTQLQFTDNAGSTTNFGSLGDIQEDTWYLAEVSWTHGASEQIITLINDLWIIGIVNNADVTDSGGTSIVYGHDGQGVVTPDATHAGMRIAKTYSIFNAANFTDRFGVGGYESYTQKPEKVSATPDVSSTGSAGGDVLDSETWEKTGDDLNTPSVSYTTGPKSGAIICNDSPNAGPLGQIHESSQCLASKFIWLLDGPAVNQTVNVLYGSSADSTTATVVDATTTVTRTNKGWNVLLQYGEVAGATPDGLEESTIGFKNGSFLGENASCREMTAAVLVQHPRVIKAAELLILGNVNILGNVAVK